MSFTLGSDRPRTPYVAGDSLTDQSAAASTDINYIVDQYTRTGVLKHTEQFEGTYGEFITSDLYELAQTKIAEANSLFESLPPGVRQEFSGGASQFLDFIQDPANKEEIEAFGLSTSHFPEPEQPDVTLPVTPETPPLEESDLNPQT